MRASVVLDPVEPKRRLERTSIGGIVGMERDEVGLQRLSDALGEAACLLAVPLGAGPADELVADWDCCYVGSSRIETLACWREIVLGGRLGEVEGAFALAWRSEDGSVSLARDAIGERSLYYAFVGGGLVFAWQLAIAVCLHHWFNFYFYSFS